MLVTVKALQGRECSLQVSPEEPVGRLKLLVSQRLQVPVEQQRLLYRGKALSDERRLSDYAIGPSARLNLVLKPPQGGGGGAKAGGGAGAPNPPFLLLPSPSSPPPPPQEEEEEEEEGEEEKPPLPHPAFGGSLGQLLGRHFGAQDVPRLLQQLHKDYELALGSLSLDDLERLGTRLLAPETGPSPPPPRRGPSPHSPPPSPPP